MWLILPVASVWCPQGSSESLKKIHACYIKTHIIYHGNNIYSFYAHLSSAVVTSGFVTKGTLIGYSGNTGTFSQGAHLHFEIRAPGASWDKNCKNPCNMQDDK